MENHDKDFKGIDEAVHTIRVEDTITDSVVLGLPAFNVKGETSGGNGPKNVGKKNSKNMVKVAAKLDLLVKIEPLSFEDSESICSHEKNSCSKVNVTAQSALPINMVPKSFEDSETCSSHKKNFNMVKCTAQSALPIKIEQKSFEDSEFGFSHEKNLALLIKAKTEPPEENEACIVLGRNLVEESIVEGAPGHHQVHLDRGTQVEEIKLYGTTEDNGPLSFNNCLKVEPETVECTQAYCRIPPCESGGKFEHKIALYSDFPVDILDYVPLKHRLEIFELPIDLPVDILDHAPFKYRFGISEHPCDFRLDILDHVPLKSRVGTIVSEVGVNAKSNFSEEIPPVIDVSFKSKLETPVSEISVNAKSDSNFSEEILPVISGCHGSINDKSSLSSRRRKRVIASVTSDGCSFGSVDVKASFSPGRRKVKKTATVSVEKAMEEDAPGLLQVLLDRGIQLEEIKLYGDIEYHDPLEETSSSEESFEEFESLMTKLFSECSSLLGFSSGRHVKGSRHIYCLASLISLIEQSRYLLFRQNPVEWGWCRDLQSFIFVFKTHNRIVLERPEYGYATYFFELVVPLPIDWQIKRLVRALKLTTCSRTVLIENKPLIVGEDLSEGEARVLEEYGWTPNTGFGTLLNYCDRVVHDRKNETYNLEWRAKIGRLLRNGYDGGQTVLANIPKKAVVYMGFQDEEIKLEPSHHPSPPLDSVML